MLNKSTSWQLYLLPVTVPARPPSPSNLQAMIGGDSVAKSAAFGNFRGFIEAVGNEPRLKGRQPHWTAAF